MANRQAGETGPPGPPAGGAARGPLIHVSTRCETLDDFVEKFAGLASEGALVLPASGELPIGTEGRFAIRLKDQSVAMRGRCRVTDARPAPPGPTGSGARATLLRVSLLEMEEASTSVHRRLLARRRAAVPVAIPPEPSDPTVVSPPRSEPAPAQGRPPPPPPVSGLAATMIGVAPPRARAGTSPLGVPRAPVLAEPRPPGTPFALPPNPLSPLSARQQVETRVPGAAFTLPANPLSEMNATDLASFIDSTLFESDDEDATAERIARPATDEDETLERPAHAPPVEVAPERVEQTERNVDAVAGGRPPPSVLAPLGPPGRWSAAEVRRIALRAAPYLACTLVGIALGHAIQRPAQVVVAQPPAKPEPTAPPAEAPPAEAPPVVARPAAPPAEVAPPVAPRAPAPERHTIADAPAAHSRSPRIAADGVCQVNVVTEPADAKVAWRGKPLGPSPIAGAAIPCGAGALTISHERYQTVTRELTAEGSTPANVSERLHRPPAELIVSSSPPGAAITVNGQAMGAAPRHVPTSRYERVTIRASLPGYATWTKKVYLNEATTKVTAQLAARGR